MATLSLRPYQREAVAAVLSDWNAGYTDVLGTAATGAGKTQIYLSLLTGAITNGQRALILAHRKELVEQPIARLDKFWPDWSGRSGVIMAQRDDCAKQITSATIQTLASPERMARLLRNGPIDYLVTDEAHHASAASYGGVYEALRQANPALRHLGVTATPIRADGNGLRQVYQKESFHYGIKEMVSAGWLVPPRWLAIKTGISLANVKTGHNGDFVGRQLADVYETDNCFELVVESHKRYADGRQAIAFVQSVDGAYRLAEAFNRAGIEAAAADGATAKGDRADVLRRFRKGSLSVLCNVGLYTEGLDVPEVSCIHQVRPTKSDGLYIQMIGRALRTVPGKVDALILDYCPVEIRNIVMLGDVLGSAVRKEAYVRDEVEIGDVLGGFAYNGQIKYLEGDVAQLISQELDYLDMTAWEWYKGTDGWFSLGLGKGADGFERILMIVPDDDGRFALWRIGKSRHWAARGPEYGDWETISATAEAIADRFGDATLAAKDKRWRKQIPSMAQLQYAQRLGVVTEGASKGEIAHRITHELATRQVKRMMSEPARYQLRMMNS